MNLKKLARYLRVNLLGPGGPSSYKKIIYRAAVSQSLRNTGVRNHVVINFPRRNLIFNSDNSDMSTEMSFVCV
jgi:hypothetical protein